MVETIKSTYDFIKDALPVRVGILASGDAEKVCMKNNLSFSDLIKPFSILTNEAQIQGPGSQSYRLYNLPVHAIDIRTSVSESATSSVLDSVAAQINDMSVNEKSSTMNIRAGDYDLNVNRTCPWMELYRNFILRSGPVQTHEYLGHLVACMLVVSSSDSDPIKSFSDISQQQNHIQHGDTGSGNTLRWMTPNTMKFYVLIHDVIEGDITKAKEVFSSLQSMYGQNYVYLLKMNSRESSANDSGTDVPAPWRQLKNMSKIDVPQSSITTICNGTETHPSSAILGCCLDIEDHSALRNFMQDFILRALLPHLEKTIRVINEQLSTRKGLHKSIFKATKAIFGSSKSSSPPSSGGYHTDSNELLVRKAADLCFLSQMYDQALHLYHGAKKDYMNDQSWLHAAGASEMAAVANFMMRNSKQSYPIQYMEYAINSYLDICKREHLALRCSLIHVECLQQVGMFQEAAFHYVRMTTEKDDLRSALLLEQAAYCYLKMQIPQPKKFAFQMVLAGHRFGKCGQKSHAIRCYEMAAQIYSEKQWRVIHDHLDYAVGRLHSSSKNYVSAMNYFRKLLVRQSSLPDVQQVFILREFGNVWHKCLALGDTEKFANLLLPQLALEETSVTVVSHDADAAENKDMGAYNIDIREVENKFLDKKMLSKKQFMGAITSLSKYTDNANGHQISVGESVSIEVVCVNHLGIPIVLHDVVVEFSEECAQDQERSGSECAHKCKPIEHVTLGANDKSVLIFTFEPLVAGKFSAKSISYNLGCQLAETSSGDDVYRPAQVVDCQPLVIKGKRLNGSREEKFGMFYASDHRLRIQSFVDFPEFKAEFQDFPTSLVCDEVREITLVVTNIGSIPISSLEFAVTGAVTLTPKGTKEEHHTNGLMFYPLDSHTLDPGQIGKYNLHLKGPVTPGYYTSNVMIFCKSDGLSSPLYRSCLLQHQLSCSDGVTVEIELINAMNENKNVISACVESIGQDTQYFSFKDVSLEMGSKVKPIGSEKPQTVPISTKLYKYFKLESDNNASGLLDRQPLEASVDWDYTDSTRSNPVIGYQTVTVKATGSVGSSSDNNISNAETLKYLHHTISWRLSTDRIYHHDFSSGQPCVIECELIAVNISKLELRVSVSASGPTVTTLGTNRAAGFSWVGTTKVNRIIQPKGKSTVVLKACFTKPGIYSLAGVIVSATPVNLAVDAPIPQKPLSSYFVTISDTVSISE